MHRRTLNARGSAFFAIRGTTRDDGFTVAEVVVAIAILFFVATAVMGALTFAANANLVTTRRATAYSIANTRLEKARILDIKTGVGTTGGGTAVGIAESGGSIKKVEYDDSQGQETDQATAVYTVTTTVKWAAVDASGTVAHSAKNINVSVAWVNPFPGNVSVGTTVVGKANGNVGTVIIKVVDDATNLGLGGVYLQIGDHSSGKTDSSGNLKFLNVDAGTLTVLDGSLTKYLVDIGPANGATVLANQTITPTIRAYRRSTGTVVVKDSNGVVLPGASVRLTGATTPVAGTILGPVISGSSDGKAVFSEDTSMGPIKNTWTVNGTKDGYEPGSTTLAVVTGGTPYTANLVLRKYPVLTVTVKNSAGAPVSGVTLTPGTVTGRTLSGPTDSNGQATYTFTQAFAAFTITAAPAGWQSGTVSSGAITMGTDPPGVAITIAKNSVLTVTVKNSAGAPVSGVTLTPGTVTGRTLSGPTDSNGQATYTFTQAFAAFTITAAPTGYQSGTVSSGAIAMGTDPPAVAITIVKNPVLLVTATNAAGTPLSGVTLTPGSVTGRTLSGTTGANGQATYTFTQAFSAFTITGALSGYVNGTVSSGAIAMGTDPSPVTVVVHAYPKLAVTLLNQWGGAVTGATLSAINSVSPAASGNVYTYTFTAEQAPTSFTASKSPLYTVANATSVQTYVDQTVSQTVNITQGKNVTIPFKFVSGDTSTKTVYVYTSKTATSAFTSFSVTKPSPLGTGVVSTSLALPPGAVYYVSCKTSGFSTSAVPTPTLNDTAIQTLSTNVTSSN